MTDPDAAVQRAVALAGVAYAANLVLGSAVAAGLVDTSRTRWIHHGLFITTCAATAAAVATSARRLHPAAIALAPAFVPLMLLPRRGARPLSRHARTALAAAPCYLAAVAALAFTGSRSSTSGR